jgi:hypothetical protein
LQTAACKTLSRARLRELAISPYKTHEITLALIKAFRARTEFAARDLQRPL